MPNDLYPLPCAPPFTCTITEAMMYIADSTGIALAELVWIRENEPEAFIDFLEGILKP